MEELKKHWGNLAVVGLTLVILFYAIRTDEILHKIDESEGVIASIQSEVTQILNTMSGDGAARNQILQQMQTDNDMRNQLLKQMQNDDNVRNKILADVHQEDVMRNTLLQHIQATLDEIKTSIKTSQP